MLWIGFLVTIENPLLRSNPKFCGGEIIIMLFGWDAGYKMK